MSVCPSVRPSVRPSTPSILSKRLHISSIFFTGSPTILAFLYQTGWQYIPTGTRERGLRGRRMQGEYEKNQDFRQISRFISEMMRDRAIVTMEGK